MERNRFISAALAVCLFAGAAVAQNSGQTVRKRRVAEATNATSPTVREAEAAIEKQDWAAAEAKLKAATTADPKDYQAWYYLGFVSSRLRHHADAISAYRRSVELKPDVFESNLNLGLALAKQDDVQAEKYLRAATALKPSSEVNDGRARAWMALGRVIEGQKPADALAAYGEVARLLPKAAEPHIAAGALLEQQARWPEAEAEFRKAAELEPKSTEALAGLVNVAMGQKRFAEAEALLRQYLAAEPGQTAARVQLGRVLAAQKKFAEATTELEAGLAAAPDDPLLARELAAVYTATDQWAKATPLYARLVRERPDDAEVHRVYGVALLRQKDYTGAQQQLITALKLDSRLADAYGDLALAASQGGNHQLAIQALDARAQYLPESAATFFLRATSYDHLRLFKQASEYYKRFLQVSAGQSPDQEWQARHRLKAIDKSR
jgi:Tfp pilus assembly protein PilF